MSCTKRRLVYACIFLAESSLFVVPLSLFSVGKDSVIGFVVCICFGMILITFTAMWVYVWEMHQRSKEELLGKNSDMIRPEKYDQALRALKFMMTRARFLAYEGETVQVANSMDAAEILPKYIAGKADSTEIYRSTLADIAVQHVICSHVIEEFDQEQPMAW